MEDTFRTYYRNLPHWRARGYPYFVTWRLHNDQPVLSSEERTLVVNALRHFDVERYDLEAYVVMDDHVHVIVFPNDDVSLEKLFHSWKSFTAHEMVKLHQRSAPVWQDESFDRLPRNEQEYYQKCEYILNNPKARWPDIDRYEWVWVRGMSEK